MDSLLHMFFICSPELLQIENEITPTVSESEASNVTKPTFVPVKKKKKVKPVKGKKKHNPKHLDLGLLE